MRCLLTYLIFFVSGMAALIYQVVWVRQLSLVFGGSHLAISTVLAVFMGGIALGGYVATKFPTFRINGLRTYAYLEFGIALGVSVFHLFIKFYPELYVSFASLAPLSIFYLTVIRALMAIIVLLPITTLMGATLPVLVDYFTSTKSQIGSRLSALYAINTTGAVGGVLLAGFVLLPKTGVNVTVCFALLINLLTATVAWFVSGHVRTPIDETSVIIKTPSVRLLDSGIAKYVLIATAVSGFCALAYEVLWTRVLIVVVGATDYGFTSILAAFLVGIGVGSAIYNRYKTTQEAQNVTALKLLYGLGGAHLSIGILILTSVIGLYQLPTFYLAINTIASSLGLEPFYARQMASLVVAFIYLGLPAVVMGASFPLAGDLLARYQSMSVVTVGQLAATNTVGALLGALVAGFVLIQSVGIERSLYIVILINLTCGLFLIFRSRGKKIHYLTPLIGAVLVLVTIAFPEQLRAWDQKFFAVYRSNQPEQFISQERIEDILSNYKILYYGEGVSSIVAASQIEGLKIFTTNGRVEATNALQDRINQLALGHLPMLLHPEPKKVLVVGGGAGMTLGATSIYPSVERVTLAEIEPKVLGVIRAFSDTNQNVLDYDRLQIVINDGRNYLLTEENASYDVITSDPIHPLFRGSGYLYTEEYFNLASSRLNFGGVMAQWLPLYQMSGDHIKSVVASFSSAFEYTSIWLLYADAVLVGSNQPITIDLDRIDRLQENSPLIKEELTSVHMGGRAENLLSYFLTGYSGAENLRKGAVINTDNNLYLEFSTPKAGKYTEVDNLMMLSTVRESVLPYVKAINNNRLSIWSQLESNGTFDSLDKLHYALISKQSNSEQMMKLIKGVSANQDLGRWQILKNYIPVDLKTAL